MATPKKPVFHGVVDPHAVFDHYAAAPLLGCRPDAVAKLCNEGKLKGRHPGHGGWRISGQAILDYLEARP